MTTVKTDFLTAKQAVEFLGITQSYLYKLTHKRVLPFYKPFGKMVYFKQSDLTAFFERGRIAPSEEIEQQASDYALTARKGGRR